MSEAPKTYPLRPAAVIVLLAMIGGSLLLWIGAPALALWLASQLTSSVGTHLVLVLGLAIGAMTATAIGLVWLNSLYLRITGGELTEVDGLRLRRRGPLETLLVISLVIAVIAFAAWFFAIAENPTVNMY